MLSWVLLQLKLGAVPKRRRAAESLRTSKSPRIIAPLVRALRDKDSEVRLAAANTLQSLGWHASNEMENAFLLVGLKDWNGAASLGASSARPLVAALARSSARGDHPAAEALVKIGNAAVMDLAAALKHKDWFVRETAARALGKIKDPRAVAPLASQLRDEQVGVSAASALGEIGDPSAVKYLAGILKSRDSRLSRAAVNALGRIGDVSAVEHLVASLKSRDRDFRVKVTETLGEIGNKRAVQALLPVLGDKDHRVRVAVINALGSLGDTRAIEALAGVLKESGYCPDGGRKDWDFDSEGEAAAIALGRIANCQAVEPLSAALKNNGSRTRRAATEALEKIGDVRAVGPLITVLTETSSKDDMLKVKVVEALGKFKDTRAVEPLIDALKDKNNFVSEAAVLALGEIGDLRAVLPLVAALEDRRICETAARILQLFGWQPEEDRQQALLAVALKDWESAVSLGAVAVGPIANALKDRYGSRIDTEAKGSLVRIGPAGVMPLAKLLNNEDKDKRREVASVLGEIADQRSVGPLIGAIKDEDSAVRKAVVEALGKIKSPEAIDPLIAALKDKDAREKAAEALGEIGDARAVGALAENLLSKDGKLLLGIEGIKALGTIGNEQAVDCLLLCLSLNHLNHASLDAVSSLEQILNRSAARIPIQQLTTLATLKAPLPRYEWVSYRVYGNNFHSELRTRLELVGYESFSCPRINSLAGMELEQRCDSTGMN